MTVRKTTCLRLLLGVLVLTLLAIPMAACGDSTTSEKYGGLEFITAMGGTAGGSAYNIIATQMVRVQETIPEITTNTIEGGSSKNILAIEQGKADIGYASTGHVLAATKGEWDLGTPAQNLRFFKHYVAHALAFHVRDDSSVKDIADLKGKHIALKPKGFGTNAPALAILAEYGITEESNAAAGGSISYLGTSDQGRALQDKTVDVIIGANTPFDRMAHLIEGDEMFGLRMLEPDPAICQKVISAHPDITPAIVNPNLYKGNPDVYNTVGLMYNLYVRADLPDDLVYEMAKSLFDQEFLKECVMQFADQITAWCPENCMLGALPEIVPIHPGVMKYANEKGLKPRLEIVPPTAEALGWMPGK